MPWVICSGAERCPSPGVWLRTHVGYSTYGRAEGVTGCLGDGESHLEELDLVSHPESTALQGATGVVFCSTPLGTLRNWHTGLRRRYIITLSGAAEIGLRDGATRHPGPDDVKMAEDLTGHGHSTRVAGQVPQVTAIIHMDP